MLSPWRQSPHLIGGFGIHRTKKMVKYLRYLSIKCCIRFMACHPSLQGSVLPTIMYSEDLMYNILYCTVGYSFISLGKTLLEEGYDFILSEKILCQDPLEQYFSKQRDSTGSNNNPTMAQVLNYNRLHNVCQSVEVELSGNCTHTTAKSGIQINNEPLKKRPRSKNAQSWYQVFMRLSFSRQVANKLLVANQKFFFESQFLISQLVNMVSLDSICLSVLV